MGAKQSSVVPTVTSSDSTEELFYHIISSDNREFNVSELALQQSGTLSEFIGDYTKEDLETKTISIDKCDGATLELVFKWCEHHKGEPVTEDDGSVPEKVFISDFDENLMDIDGKAIFNLIKAATYLNIQQLLYVSCKKFTMMAKGKTPDELRLFYGMKTDGGCFQ